MNTLLIHRQRLRRLVPAALLPTGSAVAAIILTAPAAHALTELQIENQCKANGGTYTHYTSESGEEWSTCCYKKANGKQDCDYFFNGEYRTTVFGNATPPPVGQPAQPPPATAAPGAPVMPGQGPQPVQPPPATEAPVIP